MAEPITVTFKAVLHGVHTRCGGSPGNLTPEDAAAITEYINSAYKLAWRHYEWPDALNVEERTTDADGAVPKVASGETTIETLFLATEQDPRTARNPRQVRYKEGRGEFLFGPDYVTADVWLVFRAPVPVFSSEEWSSTEAYAVGDVVYLPSTGHCYTCIQAHTNHTPPNGTYWTVTAILDGLAEAVKAGAHAAMMRDEGQAPIAQLMDDAMADLLLREIERIELQEGQYRTIRVDAVR